MSIANFLGLMPNYIVTKAQLSYARYLEQEGLVLLKDFGFESAEYIAWERLEQGAFILGHA